MEKVPPITSDPRATVVAPWLRAMVELGLDLDSDASLSPLTRSVLMSRLSEWMEEAGASWAAGMDAKDDHGRTALRYSVELLTIEATAALLAARADPNIADKRGWTLLHAACNLGDREAVALLLKAGATDSVDVDGTTPVLVACEAMAWDVVTMLLADPKGFDASMASRSSDGRTPLHVVLARSSQSAALPDTIRAVVAHAGGREKALAARDSAQRTPLHVAAARGLHESCALLLKMGADPDARDARGRTPLHLSASRFASHGTRSALKTLVEGGADVRARDQDGLTPLQILLELLADPDRVWSESQNALLQLGRALLEQHQHQQRHPQQQPSQQVSR